MEVSSHIRIRQYRSPLPVVAAMLWRSRESIARRLEKCKKQVAELCKRGKQQEALLQQARDEAEALRRQLLDLRIQVQTLKYGVPMALVVDGAPELRDSAKVLQQQRPEMIVLNDFKHKAANILKATVDKDEYFIKFNSLVGSTRNAVQQTELAHLRPPHSKPKARFMNLAAILHWAAMIVWLLDHPEAKGHAGIADERFAEKLGWVREFSEGIAIWNECQDVVSAGVTFMNEQGLFRGATGALRATMGQTSSLRTWPHPSGSAKSPPGCRTTADSSGPAGVHSYWAATPAAGSSCVQSTMALEGQRNRQRWRQRRRPLDLNHHQTRNPSKAADATTTAMPPIQASG